ncbi:uncharacterized protein BJ212DRAFT_1233031, partial [Suillus subaureus]
TMALTNLRDGLFISFNHQGYGQDLDGTIVLLKGLLSLYLVGHKDQFLSLNNLAGFNNQGDNQDLDAAIALTQIVLGLHSISHPDRTLSLNNCHI